MQLSIVKDMSAIQLKFYLLLFCLGSFSFNDLSSDLDCTVFIPLVWQIDINFGFTAVVLRAVSICSRNNL